MYIDHLKFHDQKSSRMKELEKRGGLRRAQINVGFLFCRIENEIQWGIYGNKIGSKMKQRSVNAVTLKESVLLIYGMTNTNRYNLYTKQTNRLQKSWAKNKSRRQTKSTVKSPHVSILIESVLVKSFRFKQSLDMKNLASKRVSKHASKLNI